MFGSKGIVIEIRAHEVRGILYSSFFGKMSIEKTGASPVEGGNRSSAVERLLSAFPPDAAITLQLPGRLFMVRNLSLPFTDRKKVRKTIPFEMEGILPFPADELLFDSIPSHSTEKGNSVMALAIPEKAVSGYMGLFPEGRRPARVIPDLVSLLSLGINSREKGTYGVLNVEDDMASIVLISDGRPVMMRSAVIPHPSIADWVASTVKSLQDKGQKVDKIYVTGGGERHVLSIQDKTIPFPKTVKGIDDDWPSWAALAGGAISASEFPWLNLLGPGTESERIEKTLKAVSIGTGIILVLGTADLYLRYETASRQLSALKDESKRVFLSVMPDVKRVVKEDAQLRDALNKGREMREALAGKPSPSYLAALRGVEKVMMEHQEIKVGEAVFEGSRLTVSGEGSGITADGIKKLFSGIEGAKEAFVEEMTQGINPNSYRFSVRIELK